MHSMTWSKGFRDGCLSEEHACGDCGAVGADAVVDVVEVLVVIEDVSVTRAGYPALSLSLIHI